MIWRQFEEALGKARRADLPAGPVEYFERGDGRTVVFVHGLNVHAAHWRKVVPLLAGGFRCVTPTLPLGSHRLAMDRDADLSPLGVAGLIGELLEHLEVDAPIVVANDTGGAYAQILAARRPELFGALVLAPSDAFEHFLPWQFRWLQWVSHLPGAAWQSGQLLGRSPSLRRSKIGYGRLTLRGIPDEITASYVEPLRRDRGVRRDLTKALRTIDTRYTLDAARRLANFDKPTLLAWSDNEVFVLSDAQRLAGIIPGARLELIGDAGGFVGEDRPDALADAIQRFAREVFASDTRAPAGAAT